MKDFIRIDAVPSDVVRNSIKEKHWQRILTNMRCPSCELSGMFWTKVDKEYDPPGEEHYRCTDCKVVLSFCVPYKG